YLSPLGGWRCPNARGRCSVSAAMFCLSWLRVWTFIHLMLYLEMYRVLPSLLRGFIFSHHISDTVLYIR
ncbi:hypothetical protein L9F63_016342, partial [Diploptera punctata]